MYSRCKQCSQVSVKELKVDGSEEVNEEMIAEGKSEARDSVPTVFLDRTGLVFISNTEQSRTFLYALFIGLY